MFSGDASCAGRVGRDVSSMSPSRSADASSDLREVVGGVGIDSTDEGTGCEAVNALVDAGRAEIVAIVSCVVESSELAGDVTTFQLGIA